MRKISEIFHEVIDQVGNKPVVHTNLIDDVELKQLVIDNIRELQSKIVSLEDIEIKQNMAKTEQDWNMWQRHKESQREENQENHATIQVLKEMFEIKKEEIEKAKKPEYVHVDTTDVIVLRSDLKVGCECNGVDNPMHVHVDPANVLIYKKPGEI